MQMRRQQRHGEHETGKGNQQQQEGAAAMPRRLVIGGDGPEIGLAEIVLLGGAVHPLLQAFEVEGHEQPFHPRQKNHRREQEGQRRQNEADHHQGDRLAPLRQVDILRERHEAEDRKRNDRHRNAELRADILPACPLGQIQLTKTPMPHNGLLVAHELKMALDRRLSRG